MCLDAERDLRQAVWLHGTSILNGGRPMNGEGMWQALETAIEMRLSLVQACVKRAPDLTLLAQPGLKLIHMV
jgi:hypothetical protein